MAYDIGLGRCRVIDGESVVVELDSVIVRKLVPDLPWRRSGTSLLRCDRRLCSDRRPPQLGEELYLDSTQLSRAAPAELDLEGNGRHRAVDLRIILDGLDPLPAPEPQPKRPNYHSVNHRK